MGILAMTATGVAPLDTKDREFLENVHKLASEAGCVALETDREEELKQRLKDFIAGKKMVEYIPAPASATSDEAENDPTRPHFGEKQVRSMHELKAGVRLRVRGLPKTKLTNYPFVAGNHIKLSDIVNDGNVEGDIVLLSAPFQDGNDGPYVIFFEYQRNPHLSFGDEKVTERVKIYLSNFSVVPRKKPADGQPRWTNDAWLERTR